MMSVFSRAGAGIQNILSEWRQPASRSSLCVGSFLFGRESGHSIARPIACGNRVPPQRTVLGETPGSARDHSFLLPKQGDCGILELQNCTGSPVRSEG